MARPRVSPMAAAALYARAHRHYPALTIHLTGTFNISVNGAKWKPFTSELRVATRRPSFVWNANIHLLPGLPVCVVDSYIAG